MCEKPLPNPFDPLSADFQAAARFRFGESFNALNPAAARAPFVSVSICCSAALIPSSLVAQLVSACALAPPRGNMPTAKSATNRKPAAETAKFLLPMVPQSAVRGPCHAPGHRTLTS